MGGVGGGGGADAFAEYGGIDPNMDPELAMVLRVSMEEERARQERAAAAAANEAKDGEEGKIAGDGEGIDNNMEEDEDALLQQALAMSMAENPPSSEEATAGAEDATMEIADDDDDAAMQMALQMSMQTEEKAEGEAASGGQFQDPQFVSNVSIPLVCLLMTLCVLRDVHLTTSLRS